MATLTNAARSAAANAVVDLLDVNAPGDLQIGIAGFGTVLATLALSNPAFGAASNGVATASAISDDTSTVAGTAAECRLRDGDGLTVISGTVSTSGADINFNSVAFTTGGTCSVSSLTWTQPEAS
jgi:hypothetical protein